jgi:hypothetical protein
MKGWLVLVNKLPSDGMAIFPFILLKKSSLPFTKTLIQHERIHLQQQIELLFIPFYLWYLTEYIYFRIKFKNHHKAYLNIRFEKEAYTHQSTIDYLSKRKFWAFLN